MTVDAAACTRFEVVAYGSIRYGVAAAQREGAAQFDIRNRKRVVCS